MHSLLLAVICLQQISASCTLHPRHVKVDASSEALLEWPYQNSHVQQSEVEDGALSRHPAESLCSLSRHTF